MKFLILLILFIIIFYIGVNAVIRNLFRFFGNDTPPRHNPYNRPRQETERKDRWYAPKNKRKKVIDEDEGEYVDYEEVK